MMGTPGYTAPEVILNPEAADRLRFEEEMIRTLEGTPGVEGVAVMASLPRGRENVNSTFQIEGREVDDLNERPTTNSQSVNPEYFSTLKIPHFSGRTLEAGDREDSPVARNPTEDARVRSQIPRHPWHGPKMPKRTGGSSIS